jgi:DNA modification methylase
MKHQIIFGDVLKGLQSLKDESIHTVVTSPPYNR